MHGTDMRRLPPIVECPAVVDIVEVIVVVVVVNVNVVVVARGGKNIFLSGNF